MKKTRKILIFGIACIFALAIFFSLFKEDVTVAADDSAVVAQQGTYNASAYQQYVEEKTKQHKAKYGEAYPRHTVIRGFDNIEAATVAEANEKLYINREELNIKDITNKFLTGFMEFLEERWRAKAEKLKKAGKIVPTNRATSLYLGSIRHLFNEAKKQYNDYDRNIIIITNDPFKTFTVPKQCTVTRKRALTPELIKKIWELPYQSIEGYKMENRFNLAKDCFILSFCLMGMNSADLYNAEEREGNTIIYYRTKTRNRRADNALMKVNIPKMLMPLMEKYKDKTGKRIFNFYQNYADIASLNRSINIGLKEIGAKLKIDALQYYAARHSWATIAVNKVGIDKYTVHSALNHVDDVMKVTDIYIERDFVNENKANRKVVKYVFGK